jgi:hypothetical protein
MRWQTTQGYIYQQSVLTVLVFTQQIVRLNKMIHYQKGVDRILEAVVKLPERSLILAVDDVQFLDECKRVNPKVVTCLRHFYDKGQQFDGGLEGNKKRAREFFATFIDETFRQYAHNVDLVKGFNEYLANSQSGAEVQARLDWAEAAAMVWRDEYRTQPEYKHIRFVICSAAIGNDIPVGFAEIARNYDCVISYHAYTLWRKKVRDPGDWEFLSGRWETMDRQFRAAGYTVDWVFTEAGPFESAVTGWRSPECLNWDRDLYVEAVKQWINDVKTTNAYRNGRLYGFALFTSGRAGDVWKGYWTEQPELNMLADMVAAEWKPGTAPPPPPPPPPPEECRGLPRVQYKRTTLVIPSHATIEQAHQILDDAWKGRQSVGWSYDDAGIGDLDNRIARLYGIAPERELEFIKWYAEHYPGVTIEFEPLDDDGEPEVLDIVEELPRHETKTYRTRPLTDITTLTIHHTVSPPDRTIASIAAYHVSRDWPGIGYHYVINDQGQIYQTNYPETVSYHSAGNNGYSIAISLQGDFTNAAPPVAQLAAAKWLIADLKNTLDIDSVMPHRLMPDAATACPGNTWESWFFDIS